jgi:hypothetical protein
MFHHHDISRDAFMLHGPLAHHGYDWWWHSFTAQDAETGEDKPFFIEFFSGLGAVRDQGGHIYIFNSFCLIITFFRGNRPVNSRILEKGFESAAQSAAPPEIWIYRHSLIVLLYSV